MTSKKTQNSTTLRGEQNMPESTVRSTTQNKPSLLELARKIPNRPTSHAWPYTLPPDQQTEVLEMIQAKADGLIETPTREMVRLCVEAGIDTTINKMSNAVQMLKKRG
jgi:hypothetical protein